MTTLVVAAAIVRGGRVLAACRSGPEQLRLKWEFPGGKVKEGESAQQALRRECLEELGSRVVVGPRVGPQIALTSCSPGALQLYRCALADRNREPEPTTYDFAGYPPSRYAASIGLSRIGNCCRQWLESSKGLHRLTPDR